MDGSNLLEYLIHSAHSWEPAEKLLNLDRNLFVKYASKLMSKTEVIKLEDSSNFTTKIENQNQRYAIHKTNGDLVNKGVAKELPSSIAANITENSIQTFWNKMIPNGESMAHMRALLPGEKPYLCLICHKQFTRNHSLLIHMRTHTGEKPYQCNHCDMQFTQKGNLSSHLRTHASKIPYKCKPCEDLGKPCFYRCKYCDKHCTHKSTLTIHMRTHTGEKPYKCKYCSTRFARKHDLMNHSRTHTGEKPYRCEHCGRNFTRRSNLSAHMKTHTGERLYQCMHCSKKFTAKHSLDKHMESHVENHFYTSNDSDNFSRTSDHLVTGTGTHAVLKPCRCEECGKQFTTSGYLAAHMRTHTDEKLYEYQQGTEEEEPDDEPYTCEYCDRQFTLTSDFVNHMRTHVDGE